MGAGGAENLVSVLRSICLAPRESVKYGLGRDTAQLTDQLCSMVVLARSQLIERASWIDLCLRTEIDPGTLAAEKATAMISDIVAVTSDSPV
jgi:hypothetical protein